MTRTRRVGWLLFLVASMTLWVLFVSGCVPGKSTGAIGVTPAMTKLDGTCQQASLATNDPGVNDCAVACATQIKRISGEASAYWGHAGLARGVVLIAAALMAILAALAFHRVQAKVLWPRYPRPIGAAMLGLLLAMSVAVVVGVLGETFWVSASLEDFRKADLDLVFMKDKLAINHASQSKSEEERKVTAPSCYDVIDLRCEQQENNGCSASMNKTDPYSILLGAPILSAGANDAQSAADWKRRKKDVIDVLTRLPKSKSVADVQQRNTEVDIYRAQPVLYSAAKSRMPWWSPVQDEPVTWAAIFVMMHASSGALGYALLLLGMWVWYRTAHMSEAKKY